MIKLKIFRGKEELLCKDFHEDQLRSVIGIIQKYFSTIDNGKLAIVFQKAEVSMIATSFFRSTT